MGLLLKHTGPLGLIILNRIYVEVYSEQTFFYTNVLHEFSTAFLWGRRRVL